MEKEYLVKLIEEGLSQQKIADRCDCSTSTVKRRLKEYGLVTKHAKGSGYDPLEKDYLLEVISQGLSKNQIAEQCRRSAGSVQYWLEKYGLKTFGVGGPSSPVLPYKCSCGEDDPEKFYARTKTRCKSCQNIENHRRLRSYKEEAVKEFGGKCELCGYDKCMAALHFHHRDPSEKDPDAAKMRNRSYERNKEELKKCMLVCANCHSEIHSKL